MICLTKFCMAFAMSFTFVSGALAASFTPLGHIPGANGSGFAKDVSDDGGVVVGIDGEAFRWTLADGMEGLGQLPGASFGTSSSEGVSADGKVVVGDSPSDNPDGNNEAFRWTVGGGMVKIGDLPGGEIRSEANAVSADGSVIVGWSTSGSGRSEAFRWTAGGGMVGLGDIPDGQFQSNALGVSADGSVVVGLGRGPLFSTEAFRWTAATGMVTLGHLPGGSNRTVAWGVSDDGSVVVGAASSAASQAGDEAFRWSSGGGIVGLGDLPGGFFSSSAQDASGDGSVVVGFSDTDNANEAFVWTQATGMKRLIDVLVANGATGLDGWLLTDATAVSANGKWVVGSGRPPGEFRTEPFLAFIGNVDGSVDISGTIKSAEGQDICAMVLASGQFMFSCNPAGVLSLSGLPRENDGTVKRQIYADGFFPKIDILTDSTDDEVVMIRSGTCPNYNTPYDPGFVPDSAGKRINISGKVLLQNSQTPICAMALANGQYMFTCDGTGNYALNIPLDTNGQFKLQVYADGFAPITQKIDEFSTNNDVRMARAVECQ